MSPRTELQALELSIRSCVGVERFEVAESLEYIELRHLRISPNHRDSGQGTLVINLLKDYAEKNRLAILLSPQHDAGKKLKLLRFYRRLGFAPNAGRYADHSIGSGFGQWIWKPDLSRSQAASRLTA
jgi:GNAT superfamily N-acetyltransferase